jgi:hypothetical protein
MEEKIIGFTGFFNHFSFVMITLAYFLCRSELVYGRHKEVASSAFDRR